MDNDEQQPKPPTLSGLLHVPGEGWVMFLLVVQPDGSHKVSRLCVRPDA